MFANVMAVDKYVGNALHTVELDKQALLLPFLGDEHSAGVVGYGLQILSLARESIQIPSVWQVDASSHVAPNVGLVEELPIVIEQEHLSCRSREAEE